MAVIDGAAIRYTGFVAEIRVDVNDVARELDALLERMEAGDAVLVERNGAAVATLAPCADSPNGGVTEPTTEYPPGTWGAYFDARRKAGRWPDEDYDAFIKDLETAREWLNEEPRDKWDD